MRRIGFGLAYMWCSLTMQCTFETDETATVPAICRRAGLTQIGYYRILQGGGVRVSAGP